MQDSKTSGNYAKSIGGKAFDEAFYEGNKQMILGNHNEAVKKFKECVTLNDHSATASYLLAKEYNAGILNVYSDRLITSANNFDIKSLKSSLSSFSDIINTIEKYT